MIRYLSMDTEATGLAEDCHLIQLAFVPVDMDKKEVRMDLAVETLVKCPDFDTLAPTLNPWVLSHMKEVIVAAHEKGIEQSAVRAWVNHYFELPGVKEFFGKDKVVLLGKSLSALDIPILKKALGETYFMERFHHHTVDVTSVARSFVDAQILPPDCVSGSKLLKFLNIRDQVKHTALSDAVDMGNIYLRIIDIARSRGAAKPPTPEA